MKYSIAFWENNIESIFTDSCEQLEMLVPFYSNIVTRTTDYEYILYHKDTGEVDKFLTEEDLNHHIKKANINPRKVKVFKAE